MPRDKCEAKQEQEQLGERGHNCCTYLLKNVYHKEVEDKIEDQCGSSHNGNLFLLFRAHNCGAEYRVNVQKNKPRGKGLQHRHCGHKFSTMVEESNNVRGSGNHRSS